MKMDSNHVIGPEDLFSECVNLLDTLSRWGVLLTYNQPIFERSKDVRGVIEYKHISTPNHSSNPLLCEDYFLSVLQYKELFKMASYLGVFFDGSIFRGSYQFENDVLRKQSLTFWPAPIPFECEDLELGGFLEVIEASLADRSNQKRFKMRTPMAFDFDDNNNKRKHPVSHLHFQSKDTRIYFDRPICMSRFIKSIVAICYERELSSHPWDDFQEFRFRCKQEAKYFPERNELQIGYK